MAVGHYSATVVGHSLGGGAALLTDPPLLEIDGAGHYPHETAADRLLPALHEFLESTAPFQYTEARWRQLLG